MVILHTQIHTHAVPPPSCCFQIEIKYRRSQSFCFLCPPRMFSPAPAFVHHKIQGKFCCNRSNRGLLQKQAGAGAPAQAGSRGDPREGDPARGRAGDAAAPGLGVPLAELLRGRGGRAAGSSKGCSHEPGGMEACPVPGPALPTASPGGCDRPRSSLALWPGRWDVAPRSSPGEGAGGGGYVLGQCLGILLPGWPMPIISRGILNPVQD